MKEKIPKKEIREITIQKHISNGVDIVDASSTIISENVSIGTNVVILPNCIILGNTSLGNNCVIGPNTTIENCKLADNVKVEQSSISDSNLSENVTVGPYAHLRDNVVIKKNTHIGNYVEIKNSTLGENCFVSHLSYIGDTICGNNVNWGCGTITVNFDGKNKNQTIVGNNCFIGCNSNLIAPVTIEDDCIIAAGSTITNNVENNDLAIARQRQINKKGYATRYPFFK